MVFKIVWKPFQKLSRRTANKQENGTALIKRANRKRPPIGPTHPIRSNSISVRTHIPFPEFLTRHLRTRSGPFSFAGHRALEEVAAAIADPEIPRVDILKATQIGMTTLAGFGLGLWELTRGHNAGYFLPTDAMSRELLGQRLRHAVSPELAEDLNIVVQDRIAALGDARLYVRGLHSMLGALSVPLDINLYDEVDDLNREHFLWARQRLDGSHYAREIAFACGRHPAEGIDARFQEGTQHHRHLTCPACGMADQIPELLFPDNLQPVDTVWRIVCIRCGAPLDTEDPAIAQWVPHYPDRRDVSVSFRISALSIPWVRLDRLAREWRSAERQPRLIAPFRCSKLALPDAADRQALTADDLARVTGAHRAAPSPYFDGPAFIGIDTGDICHLAVAQVIRADTLRYVWFDAMPGEALPERVAQLVRAFDPGGILIDQRPEGALARTICRAHPGIAYLQRFATADAETITSQAEREYRVLSFDREETLAEWCDVVKRGPVHVLLPGIIGSEAFADSAPARHILAGAQRIEVSDRAGQTVYRFRSGALENHYFMAAVFAWRIAEHLHGRRFEAGDVGLIGELSASLRVRLGER